MSSLAVLNSNNGDMLTYVALCNSCSVRFFVGRCRVPPRDIRESESGYQERQEALCCKLIILLHLFLHKIRWLKSCFLDSSAYARYRGTGAASRKQDRASHFPRGKFHSSSYTWSRQGSYSESTSHQLHRLIWGNNVEKFRITDARSSILVKFSVS